MKKIAMIALAALFLAPLTSCREQNKTEAEEMVEEMEDAGAEVKKKVDGDETKIKMETENKEVKIKEEDGETKMKVKTDTDN
ncbi:hypothetical protein INR76_05340 [Marixanthomonas sp. SCSIO 43207]|uniref:hypothetical protein n=1 Tax=Marixanthomonas sp. SCSIO 43207 TaxID=2779360 RepID=UPI001CA9ED18|nr:hypothetical protein [Marixanthomonas sp. SCSIO 43207]UAB82183.1 hypothetical protein INR76_05340 [Marixanthomonas sp. SCSIO 43207]